MIIEVSGCNNPAGDGGGSPVSFERELSGDVIRYEVISFTVSGLTSQN